MMEESSHGNCSSYFDVLNEFLKLLSDVKFGTIYDDLLKFH